jgi:formiminoglutamase
VADRDLPHDPHWPRAAGWLRAPDESSAPGGDLALVGVPAHLSSLSQSGAHLTPAAVREALLRYSLFAASTMVDLSTLVAVDLGDVGDPDGPGGEKRVRGIAGEAARRFTCVLGIGGDNSVTYPLMQGVSRGRLGEWGLVTVDAHHDVRDGESNGSPVRRLIEAGLSGERVVQIGIADFANSAFYAARAREYGITVIPRGELNLRTASDVVAQALEIAGAGGRPVYVDLDVDVCDRAVVPGCPASAPGGISADELRRIAHLLARDPRVTGIDITEVDASADSADGRTVRLAALLVLEVAAGVAMRLGRH